jgi:hypothetical protein
MATITKDILQAVVQLTGDSPPTISGLEAASQTFVAGEIVFWNAGYITEIAGDTPTAIYGVAAEPAHNDATAGTHLVSVYLALETQLFAGNVLSTSLADRTLLQTDIGRVMGIQRDTTNSMTYLNATIVGGASGRVFTHKVARGTAIGDTNGRVLFNFLPGFTQHAATS